MAMYLYWCNNWKSWGNGAWGGTTCEKTLSKEWTQQDSENDLQVEDRTEITQVVFLLL